MPKNRMVSVVLVLVLSLGLVYLAGAAVLTPASPQIAALEPQITPSPTPCPLATPEPLWVDPVISPTDLLTQTITVYAGNSEWVAVDTGFDVFTATGAAKPTNVEIGLRLNQTHLLEVSNKVKVVNQGNCTYGGYTLTTHSDRHGNLLEIIQRREIVYLSLVQK